MASGVCFFLWNVGARTVNAGTLAAMNNLKIPLGVVATLLILREDAEYGRLGAAGALLVAALLVCRWRGCPGQRLPSSQASP